MIDNEIIKVLKCCYEADTTDECKFMKCPNWKHNGCKYVTNNEEYQYAPMMAINKGISKDALDLINRQKAEIRKYKNAYEQVKWERDMFEEQCKTAKAEIEMLAGSLKLYRNYNPAIRHACTEAIREFAERLCEDRVSNDPVVIAVKTELKLIEGETK